MQDSDLRSADVTGCQIISALQPDATLIYPL